MFDIRKPFPKPERVLATNYNIFIVINLIALIVAIGLIFLIIYFYVLGLFNLSLLNAGSLFVWLVIWFVNRRGQHLFATISICVALYFLAIIETLYLGWDAGFHYYLVAEMALLLLYPHKNLKVSVFFSGLILVSFVILYFAVADISFERTLLVEQLHTFNAVITMLALGATTLYFRINTSRLINKLILAANTDPLTGLLNRRRMNIELNRHCNMIKRYDQTNSLILIDIDKFKHINDSCGHSGGDDVLKQFSELLRKSLRDSDLISRWGGEEFLVLLPFADTRNAGIAAEKLRKSIEDYAFDANGKKINVTITCGVAELRPSIPIEDALGVVDKLLYQGKENGRNQVVVQHQAS